MHRYARGCIKSQRILSEARWHVPLVTKDGFFKTKRKTTVTGGSVIISDKFEGMFSDFITVKGWVNGGGLVNGLIEWCIGFKGGDGELNCIEVSVWNPIAINCKGWVFIEE